MASFFKCGKTQIQRILQKKDEIMAAYEANQSESRKRNRPLQFDEIDEAVYQWYKAATSSSNKPYATGRSIEDS